MTVHGVNGQPGAVLAQEVVVEVIRLEQDTSRKMPVRVANVLENPEPLEPVTPNAALSTVCGPFGVNGDFVTTLLVRRVATEADRGLALTRFRLLVEGAHVKEYLK